MSGPKQHGQQNGPQLTAVPATRADLQEAVAQLKTKKINLLHKTTGMISALAVGGLFLAQLMGKLLNIPGVGPTQLIIIQCVIVFATIMNVYCWANVEAD